MNAELETLLRRQGEPGGWDRLKAQPWWGPMMAVFYREAVGIQAFSVGFNILRESNGNVFEVGDNGASYGLFQINIEAGLGQKLRLQEGRHRAIEIVRDPVRAAHIMAGECVKEGVHRETDPKVQAWEFRRKVERPERAELERVRKILGIHEGAG